MRAAVVVLATLVTVPFLGAQEESAARVSFSVTRFDPEDRPSPKFEIGGIGKRTTVEVPLTDIEGPFKATLRDEQFLDFFQGASEKPALSIKVPPANRQDLLLVFVPKGDSFTVLQVHAPRAKIKGGDRYIVNATQGDLALQLGKTKPILIKTSSAGILSSPSGSKMETLPVVIKQKTGEDWKLVSTEYWTCDPRFRSFLFVYRSPRTGHITFHGFTDRLDAIE